MIINQQPLDTDVNRVGLLEAFTNSKIDMSDCTIRGINEADNTVLVQTDDLLYQVMEVEIEKRHNMKLYVTNHKVLRTYSGRNLQDLRTDLEDFPPTELTEELLGYPDVVAHFMMMTHGGTDSDQEWTQQILGVDGPNKTMLIYEEHLGQAIEVRFILVQNELYVYGLPFKYWGWYDTVK